MTSRPNIKPGDWIQVGNGHCVVCVVREPNHPLGDCEVVLTPSKPANRDVQWLEDKWEFVPSGDFGGYADKYPRLREYVRILKKGQF